jgi:hypothetical protein
MKVIQKTVDVYLSDDGRTFDTKEACEHHEKIVKGERKICTNCGGTRKVDPYGDGMVYTPCGTCDGKGWLELKWG